MYQACELHYVWHFKTPHFEMLQFQAWTWIAVAFSADKLLNGFLEKIPILNFVQIRSVKVIRRDSLCYAEHLIPKGSKTLTVPCGIGFAHFSLEDFNEYWKLLHATMKDRGSRVNHREGGKFWSLYIFTNQNYSDGGSAFSK